MTTFGDRESFSNILVLLSELLLGGGVSSSLSSPYKESEGLHSMKSVNWNHYIQSSTILTTIMNIEMKQLEISQISLVMSK
jgi:hypothetical protein